MVNVTAPGQIQDALDVAVPDATINVAAGSYPENLTLSASR